MELSLVGARAPSAGALPARALPNMRVTIDSGPLLIRSAGIKNFLYYWIQHLRRLAGADEIATVPAMSEFGPLDHDRSIAGPARTFAGLATLALSNHARL